MSTLSPWNIMVWLESLQYNWRLSSSSIVVRNGMVFTVYQEWHEKSILSRTKVSRYMSKKKQLKLYLTVLNRRKIKDKQQASTIAW